MPRRSRRAGRYQVMVMIAGAAALAVVTARAAWQPSAWQRVYATREGEVGSRTASGGVIPAHAMFVALPHRAALGKSVEVRHGTRALVVPVLDVGPWNIDDDYWVRGRRPASERAEGRYRKPTNSAGIDLADGVFEALGLKDNDWVEWRFVHKGYLVLPWL